MSVGMGYRGDECTQRLRHLSPRAINALTPFGPGSLQQRRLPLPAHTRGAKLKQPRATVRESSHPPLTEEEHCKNSAGAEFKRA